MKTMKMKWVILSAVLAVSGTARAESLDASTLLAPQTLQEFVLQDLEASAIDLINWKIGDSTSYEIELEGMGKLGTMVKMAMKDEGTGVWVKNEADLMGQKDVTEILIDRSTGKILKMIHNGREEQVPSDEIEIISQDYTEITVPAGTFKCLHIVAKSKQVSKMEIWANPQAVSLDGSLQMIMATQFGNMTLKLTQFKKN
jgi:hypothetical protein